MKFRKKPVIIDASQWFKNGDHPEDGEETFTSQEFPEPIRCEGKVVRYYRHPDIGGATRCQHCGLTMHIHGWIDTLEGGHIVCPGDWVITGVQNERYPVKDEIFRKTYDKVDDAAEAT